MHGSCIISHDLQSDLIFLFICLFTLYRCDLFVLGVTCVVRSEFLIACSSFFAWRVLSAFHNGWLFYTLIVRSMSLYLLKFYLKNVLHKFLFIFNSLSKILYRAFVFLLDAFTILTLWSLCPLVCGMRETSSHLEGVIPWFFTSLLQLSAYLTIFATSLQILL